ncbi:MAG: amidohydrolase family protein [Thermodesulfobacteriota bacterium]
MSRFICDAHVHSVRFAAKFTEKGEVPDYLTLQERISTWEPYDNSAALLWEMDRYGVDMAICNSAFNMRNEIIADQVKRHPGKLLGFCSWAECRRRGTVEEDYRVTGDMMAEEVEKWLDEPGFVGVGEGVLWVPGKGNTTQFDTWEQTLPHVAKVLEVCAERDVPIVFHVGFSRYSWGPRSSLKWCDPFLVDELACYFPKVNIIIWMEGMVGWYNYFIEKAAMVTARHDNVYLIPVAPGHVLEKLYQNPNIGPEKLIFGSDFGASHSYQRLADGKVYGVWPNKPPTHLVHHMAWGLEQIHKVEMPEEHREMILGLNIARLCKIDVKKRLREERKKYERNP